MQYRTSHRHTQQVNEREMVGQALAEKNSIVLYGQATVKKVEYMVFD